MELQQRDTCADGQETEEPGNANTHQQQQNLSHLQPSVCRPQQRACDAVEERECDGEQMETDGGIEGVRVARGQKLLTTETAAATDEQHDPWIRCPVTGDQAREAEAEMRSAACGRPIQ